VEQLQRVEQYTKQVVVAVCIIVSLFHIINVSGILTFSDMTIRAIHLMAMMFIVFLRVPKGRKDQSPTKWDLSTRIIGGLLSLFIGIYILYRWKAITSSGGVTDNTDFLVGALAVLLVLEATRRTAGWGLSLIALVFLIYPFVASYLPSILRAKSYSLERVFTFLYPSTEGIYGIPIAVAATYIILFCIFGAFLNEFGAGEFLYDLSSSLTRGLSAAAAKTSILFSALTGMISGSAAGNVAVTGTFTIPMMKKEGHKPEVAGAVEACSSTGGQFMPPIMGAAAFIMAEIVGIPYANIMKAAIIPSILFFLSLFFIVDLLAKKEGVGQIQDKKSHPGTFSTLKKGWYSSIPIIVLIYMLVIGYSPFKACFYAIITLLVINVIANRKIDIVFGKKILNALAKGASDTASIAIACAAAGIIVGVLSITGLGSKLSGMIVTLSGGHLLIALLITMIVAIILGMGLPTTAAYLVLATVVAPALASMGIPLLTAHLFVFFFGCISTITPPVALASYVAAGIAGTDVNKVGWTAFRIGLVSFILPFMFVYSPGLLLEGTLVSISVTLLFSIIGVYAISASIAGYLRKMDLNLFHRITLFIGGCLLIDQKLITTAIGVLFIAVIYLIAGSAFKKIKKINVGV
jgi:TRAP transporter 4TM/12TM fusion protein